MFFLKQDSTHHIILYTIYEALAVVWNGCIRELVIWRAMQVP